MEQGIRIQIPATADENLSPGGSPIPAARPKNHQKKKKSKLETQGEEASHGTKGGKFQANPQFKCDCPICVLQINKGHLYKEHKSRDMSLFENPIHLASFQKIIEFMIAPTPDMDSCEVPLIDTVFFGDEGKPINIIKTDKEGKL